MKIIRSQKSSFQLMTKVKKFLFLCVLLLPMILYLLLVFKLAVNIPFQDDYDAILSYINLSGAERLDLLFAQHNEHRIVFTKIISVLTHQILGEVDFRILIFIGNASLVVILYVLYLLFKKLGVPVLYFLPVPYLLFSIRLWGNATWAMASIGNYYVLLFSLLSLFFFNKNGIASLVLSMAFAVLASLTSGSGLFVFPILLIWAIITFKNGKACDSSQVTASGNGSRNATRLIATLMTFLLVGYLYFESYEKPAHHPSIVNAFLNPIASITYFFGFLGSCIPYKLPALLLGATSFISFCYLTYNKQYKKTPILYSFALLLIITAAVAAVTRSSFGVKQALSSRYAIVSVQLLASIYLIFLGEKNLLARLNNKNFNSIFLLLFALCSYLFTVHIDIMTKKRNELMNGMVKWKARGSGLAHHNQKHANEIIRKSISHGVYKLPPSLGVDETRPKAKTNKADQK